MGESAARVGEPSAADTALDRFFETFYRQRPVAATFTGIHDHDGRLPDWSLDGLARAADEMRALRCELDAAGRPADDAVRAFPRDVDLALADVALEIALAEHQSGHFVHRNPTLWTGEAVFGVLSLITRDFAPLAERLPHALARLDKVPAFLAQARTTMTAAPLDWKRRAAQDCEAASLLLARTLPTWVRDLGASGLAGGVDVERWAHASFRAGSAFDEFATWLALPDPTAAPRHWWSSRPAGLGHADVRAESSSPELLSLLIRRGHGVATSLQDLLAEAIDALAAARARLDAIAAPHGGWPAVQEALAAQHPSAVGYYARFHERWAECRAAADAHDLVTWPDAPLRYVPFPSHTREAAPKLYYLHYRSPAPFDPVGTFDYVVAPIEGLSPPETDARLRQWNESVITLNHVVHHGAIGHHVQNHHAYRGASRIGRVAAVDAACRISMFSGGSLAEGWACYVCDLMEDIGFLSPLESIAQQHTRVRIAARAVADLSLHTGRFSIPATAWHYEDQALMSPTAATAEAVRNSMYPGAAVMYWLGTREIHRLRAEVARREGPRFSLRAFHDRFLSYGAIPVALISRLMLAEESER
jgi:uncharacterized protein (DUF885 family)